MIECLCHANDCGATPDNTCFCPCHREGKEACWGCNQFGEKKCSYDKLTSDQGKE